MSYQGNRTTYKRYLNSAIESAKAEAEDGTARAVVVSTQDLTAEIMTNPEKKHLQKIAAIVFPSGLVVLPLEYPQLKANEFSEALAEAQRKATK